MRKSIIVLALIFGLKVVGQSQTKKVLFLGNSLTYVNDLPLIVSELANNTGDVLLYDSNAIGGYRLRDHYESTVSKGKIVANDWDYIVLQEQSQLPAFETPTLFMEGFGDLKSYIDQNKPCAQITSFMTWGFLNGDTSNCPIYPNVCTYVGMQDLLSDRYVSLSGVNESEVTPVGIVWKYIRENYPNINLYHADGVHPSLEGSYLAACCFYTSIFRKDPTLISNNYGLDSTTALIIRNATKEIVYNQMMEWYIGKYVPTSNFSLAIGNGINEVVLNNNYTQYQDAIIWDFGDGTSSIANNPTHSYSSDGTYTIKLTANKCFLGQNLQSVMEKTVNFCSHTHTIYPNLLLCPNTTGVIWTQPADSYQWLDYLGNPIEGATNQSLEVFSGSYSVLTTVNGCAERSPEMLVDEWVGLDGEPCTLGNDQFEKLEMLLFPNPAHNLLNVQTNKPISEIAVYDLLGKKVIENQNSTNALDVSVLESGMYSIKVKFKDDTTVSSKFSKE